MSKQETLWEPHPRQTLFLQNASYECFFGGAAGGGKSDAILMGALRFVHKKAYRALILRKSFPELLELLDRAHEIYPSTGGKWVASESRYVWPSGARAEFGFCERMEHIMRYQGRQFAYIGWDELGQCPEERMWTKLMAWNRCPDPEIPCLMRGTGNPGGPGHGWIKKRFIDKCHPDGDVWIDPFTGTSRSFIKSLVKDNPTIMEGDPEYVRRLMLLSPTERAQLLEGDWSAGTGLALDALNEYIHIIEPFEIPDNWTWFASFDWGYHHPWSFGVYAVNVDGQIVKVETITGRRQLPRQIIASIQEAGFDLNKFEFICADTETFAQHSSREENAPTVAEYFEAEGAILTRANQSRIQGLNNFREYIAWQNPMTRETWRPRFQWFDTPGNRFCFDQCETMTTDPRAPEKPAKRDADESGENGDDCFDETRYALASRAAAAEEIEPEAVSAWDPAALHYETERKYKGRAETEDLDKDDLYHPEFGNIY